MPLISENLAFKYPIPEWSILLPMVDDAARGMRRGDWAAIAFCNSQALFMFPVLKAR